MLEVSHKRRRAKHSEPARKWHRNSAVGVDKSGCGVARQHEGEGGDPRRFNTEEWTVFVRAADGSPLSSVSRMDFYPPPDMFAGRMPKTAEARRSGAFPKPPVARVAREPFELRVIGWRAVVLQIVAVEVVPDHSPVVAAYLSTLEGARFLHTVAGKAWANDTEAGQVWAAGGGWERFEEEERERDEIAALAAAEAEAAAQAAAAAAAAKAEAEVAAKKVAKQEAREARRTERRNRKADKAFKLGFMNGQLDSDDSDYEVTESETESDSETEPEPEPEPEPEAEPAEEGDPVYEVQGDSQVGFLAQEMRLARVAAGQATEADEEIVAEQERQAAMAAAVAAAEDHYQDYMRLSVRTVVGETLTFTEVPRNASVQELLEMARGAEEEFDFADSWANMDAEKESVPLQLGAKVAGPLLMLGKVQLEEAVVQEVQEAPQPEPEPEPESESGAEPPEGPKIEGLESEGMEPEEQEGEDTEATEDTIAEKKRRRRKPRQKEKVLRLLSDYGIGQLDERAELPGIETLLAMVPQHAAVQELREKIRGREEEFGLAGWAEMEEDEAFEIDATLELTIPPRGPPPPPYARECSFEHVLVGKLEGCTRKERKAVSWVDVIPEPEPEPEPEVLPIRDPRVVVKTEEELAAEAAAELAVRRKVFEELDTEGAGVLGREQVAKLVHEIDGTELTEAELDIAMDKMDGDGNGEVDFEEFSSWWIQRTAEDLASDSDGDEEYMYEDGEEFAGLENADVQNTEAGPETADPDAAAKDAAAAVEQAHAKTEAAQAAVVTAEASLEAAESEHESRKSRAINWAERKAHKDLDGDGDIGVTDKQQHVAEAKAALADAKTGKEEAEAEEMAAVEAARQAEADAENGREELWN